METSKFRRFQQFTKPSYEDMIILHQQWNDNTDLSFPGALCTSSEFLRMYGWSRSSFYGEQK